MKKKRTFQIPAILVLSFITVLVLMLFVRGFSITGKMKKQTTIYSEKGIYDVSKEMSLDTTEIVLDKNYEYYPSAYIMPDEINTVVPERLGENEALQVDYYTQRFQITVPENAGIYRINVKLPYRHALRVYVNEELAGQIGIPGETKRETEPGENNLTFTATAKNGKIDVVIHAAQFYHFKTKANLASLSIHKASPKFEGINIQEKGLIVIGILFGVTMILICMFILYPEEKATLFFALSCLAMILREFEQSQVWTKFSFLSGSLSFMLEYLSLVLLTIFLTLYLGCKQTDKFLQNIKVIILSASIIYGVLLLFTDSILYTSMLKYYQVVLLSCIVLGIGKIFWNMRQPIAEQMVSLYGIAVFYLAAISDILMYNNLLAPWTLKISVSEIAILVFVVSQTISLFMMNSRLITEVNTEKQRITREKEELERINRLKTEFLGNISHELKTPLTVMSSYAQLTGKQLAKQPETEAERHYLKLIESEADRLSLMVSQILDVTRIEENRLIMNVQSCFLADIVRKTLDTYYPVFGKNRNQLIFEPSTKNPQVSCDANRIMQVLVNLISNASHHTQNGIITVKILEEEGIPALEVSDTGRGMDEEEIKHMFERYYTSENKEKPDTGRNTGTGLGLYICQHIIMEHGGKITVQSEVGKGTTIRFTLPHS